MAKFELDQAITRYNLAAKKLGENGGSSAVSARRNVEQEYSLAARELMRYGYLWKLKRKYTDG